MSSGGPNILYLRGQFFPRRLLIPGPSNVLRCFQSSVLLPGLDVCQI